ncbi:MAG: DUF2333 family protein [Rhodospirillaceae bacterium]|nr:DUF2333 family protein [Rhodospirillaceae bacterium]
MPEFLRTALDRVKSAWSSGLDRLAEPFKRVDATGDGPAERPRWIGWVAGFVAFLVVIYYPVGMALYHTIDDDVDMQAAPEFTVEGGSRAVAIVATMVSQQTEYWAPNKPFWMPAAALDNMPNYQMGIVYAVSRFAVELGDYLGRVRGSSGMDPNLDRATGLFKYDATTWYWGQGNILPMPTAESRYREAVAALMTYNRAVAAGQANYDRRADNLIAFLDRVAADLGSASASLDARAGETGAGFFDTQADDVFYDVKGRLFAYHMILREIGVDFEQVIREKQATAIWNNMLASLRTAAEMSPLIVANGAQDSMVVPSHLSALGFYLLRARTQIREATDGLQK